jgi:PKD repeat protein
MPETAAVPLLALALALALAVPVAAADPGDVGFQGPSYTGAGGDPSGQKPESKLWWNDGSWWGSLWDTDTSDFHIHRLDLATSTWVDTGVALDDRPNSRADVLWDGQHLYVASHVSSESPASGYQARLYRYSYSPTGKTYSLDAGFPATINNWRTETLVLDKDSTGTLWATWVQEQKVYVNRTIGGDATWGTPFVLPVSGTSVSSDDISSVVAFGGNRIGVMWSNQAASAVYFAVHVDGDAATTWQPSRTAVQGSGSADDHLNLKSLQSAGGRVFAAIKTSHGSSSAPLIMLLVRDPATTGWSSHVFGTVANNHTRPIVLLDETNGVVHMFATGPQAGSTSYSTIYAKSSPLDAISFPTGLGTTFILDASALGMNNPTSTKQNVNASTGLVVLATNDMTGRYWWNRITLGTAPPPTPPIASFSGTPLTGTAPLAVSFADTSTGSPTSRLWSFGDGASSTQQNPLHTYSSPGTYTVSLTVSNSAGTDTEERVGYVVVSAPSPPLAGFTASPTTGEAPLTVSFRDTSTGTPTSWAWSFGDGTSSTAQHPTHVYAMPGTYSVSLTVTNAGGSSTATRFDYVSVAQPSALTFIPVADAYVRSSKPDTNFGTATNLKVQAGRQIHHSYLAFTVSGLTKPVTSARLRLFVIDGGDAAGTVYAVATGWSERSLTWRNAPALSGTPLASAGAAAAGAWIELDVTGAVAGDGSYAFGVLTPSTESVGYSSREGTSPPQLVVRFG